MPFDYKIVYRNTPTENWKPAHVDGRTFLNKSDAIKEAERLAKGYQEYEDMEQPYFWVIPYNEIK